MLLMLAPHYYFVGRYLISNIDRTHSPFHALSDIATGKILLGGKYPFFSDQKIVRTKKLSWQKCCPNKKIVPTKILCGQFFFVWVSNALVFLCFFCPSSSWFFVLSNFCSSFCSIVQQKHGTYFRNIFTWSLVITTCLIKLITKLPNIQLKLLSPKVWERLFWR